MRDRPTITIATSVLFGAGLGLILITLLLAGADAPDPAWGKLWMIKPLMIVPIMGGMGGVLYFFMKKISLRGKMNRTLVLAMSVIAYIISLWVGVVVGLDGTMWY